MSGSKGSKTYQITRDHKPNDEKERIRIEQSGG
jgi:serine/threonine protein phosphatase PrpC